MPKGYHHLTYEKRCQIAILKESGCSDSTIAERLNVDRSTIYRELKRNDAVGVYCCEYAQKTSGQRRHTASSRKRKVSQEVLEIIYGKLNLQWSPEQISGWMKKQDNMISVSHETIYKLIWKDKQKGVSLYKNLRHQGKKYNKRSKSNAGRGLIPGRVDIEERAAIVEEKSRIGDWELDTIIGKNHQGAIVSMVDRHSKFTMLVKVHQKTAAAIEEALIKRLAPSGVYVHTLTADNGKEFANHQAVSETLGSKFYFAKPYHSWERGLNEHTNGLVRQYFPKKSSFSDISEEDITKVENLLNNRPRKVLDFKTPIEVFNQMAA